MLFAIFVFIGLAANVLGTITGGSDKWSKQVGLGRVDKTKSGYLSITAFVTPPGFKPGTA